MQTKRKGGLGRGLSSILPDAVDDPKADPIIVATGVGMIPTDQIEMINPFQPRQNFDDKALNELADSIRIHGIIQPLTVRRLEEGKYQLIAGERRLRAAKIVGLVEVPAHIRKANDEEMLEMALIENIQREDLNPIEIANTYQRMIDELGLKQEELGDKVGKGRSTVANYLSLRKLPAEIVTGLRDGAITMGHAKALIGIEDLHRQLELYHLVIEKGLSVRQTESLGRENKETAPEKTVRKPSPYEIQIKRLEGQLEEKFGNRVKIKQNGEEKGEINIAFNSTEDLNRILEILDLN